jgi:hypothetical protein
MAVCSAGSEASVRSSWSVSRAPAATALASPAICTKRASVSSKSTVPIASVAAGAASLILARHVEADAQLTEVLTASLIQTVEELAATRISECLEHVIHRRQPPKASAS